MESVLTPPSPFQFDENSIDVASGNLSDRWERWKKSFTIYFNACELSKKTPVIQLNIFLHIVGEQCREILEQSKETTLDGAFKRLDEYFKTHNPPFVLHRSRVIKKKNLTVERQKFFTRDQQRNESIDQYVFELRKLSKTCEFGNLNDDLIKDRLVYGMISPAIRVRLLREEDLTLNKALEICRAAAVSRMYPENIKKENEAVHNIKQDSTPKEINKIRASRRNNKEGYGVSSSTRACDSNVIEAMQSRGGRERGGVVRSGGHGGRGGAADATRPMQQPKSTKAEAPAVCNSCNSVINGRIVTALNKKWHPEHFQCHTCRKPIDGAKFHQHDGGVHCVPCFASHHSPRCHGCGEPITDRVIQALGVSWHANHFVCGGCKKELGGGGFMEQAGRPYCAACYADKFAARCNGCGSAITDKAIIALDAKWHRDCFTCMKCRNPVTDATFSVMDNKPLCGKCA